MSSRPFRNAGTKEKFKKHDKPLIDAGAFANFNAAWLVDDAPVARSPRKVKPQSAAKPRAKKAAAKPVPAPAPADPVDNAATGPCYADVRRVAAR